MLALYNGRGTIIFEDKIIGIEVLNDPVLVKRGEYEVTANIHYGERGHMSVSMRYSTLNEAKRAKERPWELLVDAGCTILDFNKILHIYEEYKACEMGDEPELH